jgi:ankyrin repeat protein
MDDICRAAEAGDLAEVERLVGREPGLLNARDSLRMTPLMWASQEGHVGVIRWLSDKGAATDERDSSGCTAFYLACRYGHPAVVMLLLERGADPAIANAHGGWTPLMIASSFGHLEVVRVLLGHPSARTTINKRSSFSGETALSLACYGGHGGSVRALLENGADPTIASYSGYTPMAVAKQDPPFSNNPELSVSAEGRRECVAALEVRFSLLLFSGLVQSLLLTAG